MVDLAQQAGIAEVLLARFEHQRLPQLLAIRDRVGAGEALTDAEVNFLEHVLTDAMANKHLVDTIPQCQDLYARVVHLYHEITSKALDNESSR
jgi:hypothetical protein